MYSKNRIANTTYILLLIVVFTPFKELVAQPNHNIIWTRTYGGATEDVGYDVEVTHDGGFLISGYTHSFGRDFYLIRTDQNGDTLWTRYPGLHYHFEKAYAVVEDWDGFVWGAGIGLAGRGGGPYGYSAVVYKLTSEGDSMWYHDYGGVDEDDIAYDMILAQNYPTYGQRGYIIAGTTNADEIAGAQAPDAFLIRFNVNGTVVWTHAYHRDGSLDESAFGSVAPMYDGGYICAGYASDWFSSDLEQGFIVKTDSVGNMVWRRTWGLGGNCCRYYNAGKQGVDSTLWFVGAFMDGDNYNSVVHRWTKDGAFIRSTVLGGEYDDDLLDLVPTPDGNCVVVGYTQLYDESLDIYLAKIDTAGNVMWEYTYGGHFNEIGYALQRLPDGMFAIAGQTTSYGAGAEDVWLLKVNPDNVTPVEEPRQVIPTSFVLSAYPNPFNNTARINISIDHPVPVKLNVYDISGRLVQTLLDGNAVPPEMTVQFDGGQLPSGSYFLHLTSPTNAAMKRILLIK